MNRKTYLIALVTLVGMCLLLVLAWNVASHISHNQSMSMATNTTTTTPVNNDTSNVTNQSVISIPLEKPPFIED